MALVPDLLGQVLDQVAAAQHVQELEAAADRERRQVALERGLEEAQLARIAVGLRRIGSRVPVGAVVRRIDVDAAGEHDPVEHVERLLDRVLARRHDERAAAGLLDRLDVVERHECRRQLPCAPARGLGVGGDADDRAAVARHGITLSNGAFAATSLAPRPSARTPVREDAGRRALRVPALPHPGAAVLVDRLAGDAARVR